MKSTSSLNEKKVIIDSIKNNEFITSSLNYTYDPYKKYYVTSKTCKKNSGLFKYNLYNDLFNFNNVNNFRELKSLVYEYRDKKEEEMNLLSQDHETSNLSLKTR